MVSWGREREREVLFVLVLADFSLLCFVFVGMHLLQRDGEFLLGHDLFLKRVGTIFYEFIENVEKDCVQKSMDDLKSTTRYVTWSLHNKNKAGLKSVFKESDGSESDGGKSEQETLIDLLEGSLWTRKLGSISEDIVAALVCRIFEGIRDFFVQAIELKVS